MTYGTIIMALTAAEKQKRYRAKINSDPVARERYLQKERERWKERKEMKKVK